MYSSQRTNNNQNNGCFLQLPYRFYFPFQVLIMVAPLCLFAFNSYAEWTGYINHKCITIMSGLLLSILWSVWIQKSQIFISSFSYTGSGHTIPSFVYCEPTFHLWSYHLSATSSYLFLEFRLFLSKIVHAISSHATYLVFRSSFALWKYRGSLHFHFSGYSLLRLLSFR